MPMSISVSADGTTATIMGVTVGQQALQLPSGTTAQRPASPVDGFMRFNTTLGVVEKYIDGFWLNHAFGYTAVDGTSMTTSVYAYTGDIQTHTVAAGKTAAFIKLWGAGGGGGSYGSWRNGGPGGGGGFTEGIVPVQAGDVILIRVGGPGRTRFGTNRAWPDGGASSTYGYDNQYVGSGGASSSVAVPRINNGKYCMFAGGGGGGGVCNGYATGGGGAGGGLQGDNASVDLSSYLNTAWTGRGGTQTRGGYGAMNTTNIYYGAQGTFMQGANYPNYGSYGGGGGGGYYGGGSGGHGPNSGMGSGGGGSGYIHPDVIVGVTIGGMGQKCGNPNDPVRSSSQTSQGYTIANGGEEGASGGSGLVVIYTV